MSREFKNALPKLTQRLQDSVLDYAKRRVKKLRFSHAFYNVITYEIVSAHKGTLTANKSTLIILTGLPAQHLMTILCDEYHNFPLG